MDGSLVGCNAYLLCVCMCMRVRERERERERSNFFTEGSDTTEVFMVRYGILHCTSSQENLFAGTFKFQVGRLFASMFGNVSRVPFACTNG